MRWGKSRAATSHYRGAVKDYWHVRCALTQPSGGQAWQQRKRTRSKEAHLISPQAQLRAPDTVRAKSAVYAKRTARGKAARRVKAKTVTTPGLWVRGPDDLSHDLNVGRVA
jgi:hypothetical protein